LALSFSDFAGGRIKHYYGRPRPANNPEIQAITRSDAGHYSFYSNHTSNMFTFATYASQFFPAAKIALYILAAAVGYSRIYNGVHYPTDVFGGMVMGLMWGYLFSFLVKRLQAWLLARKAAP
jgi:undecaprenyl-diphosphatase